MRFYLFYQNTFIAAFWTLEEIEDLIEECLLEDPEFNTENVLVKEKKGGWE